MESYMSFLVLVAFGAMVWAGGVTIMLVMARRELDPLERDAKEREERAEFHRYHSDQQDAEIERLQLENARLGSDLLIARNTIQRLRVKTGEIAPDGRLLPRMRSAEEVR